MSSEPGVTLGLRMPPEMTPLEIAVESARPALNVMDAYFTVVVPSTVKSVPEPDKMRSPVIVSPAFRTLVGSLGMGETYPIATTSRPPLGQLYHDVFVRRHGRGFLSTSYVLPRCRRFFALYVARKSRTMRRPRKPGAVSS